MKKNIIYYTNTGEPYTTYCVMSIRSLLKNGNFNGDIYVFCSKDDFEKYREFLIENVYVFDILDGERTETARIKSALEIINPIDYNQIMYLDGDTLIKKDINPMFCADNCIMFAKEPYNKSIVLPKNNIFCSYLYTEEEYERFKFEPIVNAGIFCIDASIFTDLIGKMNYLLDSADTKQFGIDQSAFNKLINTNMIPSRQWNQGYIRFFYETQKYPLDKDNVIINHYLLNSKKQMFTDFEKIYEK